MFITRTVYGRAGSSTTTSPSSTTASSTSTSSVSTSTTTSSSSSTTSSSSSSSSPSSSSVSSTSSSSSSSSSSTSSSSTSSTSSSTSASASATSTSASSSHSSHSIIGPIVGGAIAGVVVLALLSFMITALRRKRRNARKRPRGSVYIGNMDPFLGSAPRANKDSMHSNLPLLSVPHTGPSTPSEYTDAAVPYMPSPYSDHGHGTGQQDNGDTSGYLPSPYSQHGHGDETQESGGPVPELPPPRLLTASPRPASEFYDPIVVQPAEISFRALEGAVSGSRPGTPVSLSMTQVRGGPSAIPGVNEAGRF
ncbi:hypothetical protein BT96DRAFT_1011370 [Gymnopus androsaceus JB14]|uniref:REJ domain-containing protein n=1 Tax=Gymnopus androsaceus JB14 TaxID=1447944 RepID=A0A6A4IVJ5_9AGAR|nr:hypothetical protein BT96DRAFT_1011370 [Gymnopus androsaceus JB14]